MGGKDKQTVIFARGRSLCEGVFQGRCGVEFWVWIYFDGLENSKYEALSTKYYSLLMKNNGAYTELISIGPELMQTHQLFKPIH